MGNVFVENLVLRGKHGVHESERASAQEFRVDISADVDTQTASRTDALSDTANYSNFIQVARSVVEGPSLKLLETIANRIAEGILKDKRVQKVSVTVRKPRVSAGVTLERSR